MSEELLVNVTPVETRVAVVENGMLQEVYIERSRKRGIVGNIYKGRVVRVLPGMEAAFVDIGLERAAFLHVSDIASSEVLEYYDSLAGEVRAVAPVRETAGPVGSAGAGRIGGQGAGSPDTFAGSERGDRTERNERPPSIGSLLAEGQSLIVQVTKDPIGTKGARLTTQLSIPTRYLVFMPGGDHIGVSQRIEQDEERQRLRGAVQAALATLGAGAGGATTAVVAATEKDRTGADGGGSEGVGQAADSGARFPEALPAGYIVRTAAEGVGIAELAADVRYLQRLWGSLSRRIGDSIAPALIYEDLPLSMRTLRDLIRPDTEKVRVDSREVFQKVFDFATNYVAEIASLIEHYPGERPIFDLYGVEDEIQKALSRKVQLKSGGYLIIDQTEAMTTIDVNTGAFVGHRNLEETIFKTNLEASRALARQLRLRNLGGIIIIDFIDMEEAEHQRQVLRMLEKMLERDHARTHISCVSELGLVEMTRKRTTESLGQLLCEPCAACDGRGTVKTPETLCYEIFREILRINRSYDGQSYRVLASQAVVDLLLDQQSESLADLETFMGKSVRFQVESLYTQEQFDVVIQ